MAYVIGAVFVALTGHFFVGSISSPAPEASISGVLIPTSFALVLWAPIASMRMLAEEQKLGTLELLLTAPLRDWEIVLGKFVALVAMLLGIMLPTLVYVIVLVIFATPDLGPLFTGYLGLLMYGSAAASLGLFTSSVTSNQIVAGVTGAISLLFLTIAGQASSLVSGLASVLLRGISLPTHLESLVAGVIEVRDLVYFLTFIAFFLFLTTLSVEARRWR
jgi:ABC-2 type transport system permease protein